MRAAFESILFRCCRKICFRLCGRIHLSNLFPLRCEALHESFTREGHEVRSLVYGQRREEESTSASHGKIAGRATQRTGVDGHERRMRRGSVRFVCRLVGRDAGEQLSRSGGASERRECSHHRRSFRACLDEAFARGVPGMRRRAVRHLHAGNGSCRSTLAREATGAGACGHSRGACGQSLPLHGLHADFPSGDDGSAAKSCKMRADPSEYKLVSPGNLQDILSLMASEPAQWLPIAGGTDVMVLYSAGKLPNPKLVKIWNIPELRQIAEFPDRIPLGAARTYTRLAPHRIVS